MNRLTKVVPQAIGSPEYNMKRVLQALGPSQIVPEPNKYYTFIYKAKTKNIQYDQHPIIQCRHVFPWGFSGVNFHWEDFRRYSWLEVVSNVFELSEEEVKTALEIDLARIKST